MDSIMFCSFFEDYKSHQIISKLSPIQASIEEIWPKYVAQAFLPPPPESSAQDPPLGPFYPEPFCWSIGWGMETRVLVWITIHEAKPVTLLTLIVADVV